MSIYEIEVNALEDLNDEIKEEYTVIETEEIKSGLFKGTKQKVKYALNEEIIEYIKTKLINIVELMGLEANVEVKKGEQIKFNLYSNNNALLIGKNGKNITSLQILLKQIIYNNINKSFPFVVDVENYKESKTKHIEYLAKKTAREVKRTKIETKLTNMNAYERRIVHSILADFDGIYTESEGEEPNRYVKIRISE